MKATSIVKQTFQPVKLTITFETKEELLIFYNIFNHGWITEYAHEYINDEIIRDELTKAYPDTQAAYYEFFCGLDNHLKAKGKAQR
jgi:hypothetical protein